MGGNNGWKRVETIYFIKNQSPCVSFCRSAEEKSVNMSQSSSSLLAPYYSKRQVELAAALVMHQMGLHQYFKDSVKLEQNNGEEEGIALSSLEILVGAREGESEVDEASVLGDIFASPDKPSSEANCCLVTLSEFRASVLLLRGLWGMVERAGSDRERLEVLSSGQESSGEVQPVYRLLSYFHQQLGSGDTRAVGPATMQRKY